MEERQWPKNDRRESYAQVEAVDIRQRLSIEKSHYPQNVSQNHKMVRITNLILDSRHFSSLRTSALSMAILKMNPLTCVDADNQPNKHSVQTSNGSRQPLPGSLPFPRNRLTMVMSTKREILSQRQTDMPLVRMTKISIPRMPGRCI